MRPPAGLSRRAFLAACAAAPVAAGVWEKKPFSEWTSEDTDKILTDSPWAVSHDLKFEMSHPGERPVFDFSDIGLPAGIGLPQVGGIPGTGWPGGGPQRSPSPGGYPGGGQRGGRNPSVRAEAFLTIRWSTALPIRQALLLEEYGSYDEIPRDAIQSLDEDLTEYVVEIFGLPTIAANPGPKELEEQLRESASLGPGNRRRIPALDVRIPEHGSYLSMTFRFPREAVTLEDKQIEFYASAGPFEIQHGFKLKKMVHQGRLEL